jgi:hypothetical protein
MRCAQLVSLYNGFLILSSSFQCKTKPSTTITQRDASRCLLAMSALATSLSFLVNLKLGILPLHEASSALHHPAPSISSSRAEHTQVHARTGQPLVSLPLFVLRSRGAARSSLLGP